MFSKKIFFVFLFIGQLGFAKTLSFNIEPEQLEASPFIEHSGSEPMQNYLAVNLPYKPIKLLFDQLEKELQLKLKNRGEAHITVVTPVEYVEQLRPFHITMSEINKIAEKFQIQKAKFKYLCLGRGEIKLKEKNESTYFIVVESNDLLKIRREIYHLVKEKTKKEILFNPTHFFPHITVGFTSSDLHESDGVIKDIKSCIYDLSN